MCIVLQLAKKAPFSIYPNTSTVIDMAEVCI